MKRISEVRVCRTLARNAAGRDFVVGDLHGHRRLLEAELESAGFDASTDRVLSVGDLIDRGPESLETLALIEEPWFHAVLGNHEMMLLNHLGYYDSRIHSRKAFAAGGGRWVAEAAAWHRKRLGRLADRVATLPLVIHVEADVPFNVMHGDLQSVRIEHSDLSSRRTLCVHEADRATTSRANIGEAVRAPSLGLRFGPYSVQVSHRPLGSLALTYVGHSPVRRITIHNSYVYIDRGVCGEAARLAGRTLPALLEHDVFAGWFAGVATAVAGSVPAASDRPAIQPARRPSPRSDTFASG